MHAGMANNGNGRRAHGGKFLAAGGETTIPAGIQNEKCTPAWRTTTAAGGHTVPNSRRQRQNDHAGGDTE
ncbi:hypothetical protein [Bianquea renquensis]|uniref:Uncharacterized protein n=1 Tax=Bianquea renquensis TaxID=2763661 RepID=A0A926DTL1_9FIRM|nr:hypothetical protein [Bianquea renquensis]MBC8543552.1 hypothetical protein [Bianquea renquensis]